MDIKKSIKFYEIHRTCNMYALAWHTSNNDIALLFVNADNFPVSELYYKNAVVRFLPHKDWRLYHENTDAIIISTRRWNMYRKNVQCHNNNRANGYILEQCVCRMLNGKRDNKNTPWWEDSAEDVLVPKYNLRIECKFYGGILYKDWQIAKLKKHN